MVKMKSPEELMSKKHKNLKLILTLVICFLLINQSITLCNDKVSYKIGPELNLPLGIGITNVLKIYRLSCHSTFLIGLFSIDLISGIGLTLEKNNEVLLKAHIFTSGDVSGQSWGYVFIEPAFRYRIDKIPRLYMEFGLLIGKQTYENEYKVGKNKIFLIPNASVSYLFKIF